jgi:DNA-binding CsgD family transcriptional regulator/PAS domain-containing protein
MHDHSPRFVAALEAIYLAAAEPSEWPSALQSIADVFDDVGTVMIYGRDDGTFGVIASESLALISAEYAEGWSDKDIRAIRARERGYFFSRDVITDRNVLTPDEVENHPFYADLLKRHGLKYFAAGMVSPDPHVEVAVSVQRGIDKPEYTEEELATLARLGSHIERSLRLSIRLIDAELSKTGLGDSLARVGIGVFILDSVGRVVFSNPAAQSLVGDGIEIVNERLAIASLVGAHQGNAVKRVIECDPGTMLNESRPMLIERPASGRPLTVYMLPVPVSNKADTFLTHARAIVLVLKPESDAPPDPALIRDILGLTLGEARVASLVAFGMPPRDAAEKLGITENTARTVLKRVFAKVGISRQSELATLLSRLVLK